VSLSIWMQVKTVERADSVGATQAIISKCQVSRENENSLIGNVSVRHVSYVEVAPISQIC
jgi:hypothetical protein